MTQTDFQKVLDVYPDSRQEYVNFVLALEIEIEQRYSRVFASTRFMSAQGRAVAQSQLQATIYQEYTDGVERIQNFMYRKYVVYGATPPHQPQGVRIAGFVFEQLPMPPLPSFKDEQDDTIEKPIS